MSLFVINSWTGSDNVVFASISALGKSPFCALEILMLAEDGLVLGNEFLHRYFS